MDWIDFGVSLALSVCVLNTLASGPARGQEPTSNASPPLSSASNGMPADAPMPPADQGRLEVPATIDTAPAQLGQSIETLPSVETLPSGSGGGGFSPFMNP